MWQIGLCRGKGLCPAVCVPGVVHWVLLSQPLAHRPCGCDKLCRPQSLVKCIFMNWWIVCRNYFTVMCFSVWHAQILPIFHCPQAALFPFCGELMLRGESTCCAAWIFHKQSRLRAPATPMLFSSVEVLKLQPEVAWLLQEEQPSGNTILIDKGRDDLR